MAQRVVDHLEAVEVEEQHPDHPVVARPPVQRVGQPFQQERPVGEAGQLVVEGPLLQLGCYLHTLGHVAGIDHHSGHGRVGQQVGGYHLHVAPSTLSVGHPGLHGRRHSRGGQDFGGMAG